MPTLAEIITHTWPDAEWRMTDSDNYETLLWFPPEEKPTLEEILSHADDTAVHNHRASLQISRSTFLVALEQFPRVDGGEGTRYDHYQEIIANLPRYQRILADNANYVERLHPLVVQFGPVLGFTEEEIDAIFTGE